MSSWRRVYCKWVSEKAKDNIYIFIAITLDETSILVAVYFLLKKTNILRSNEPPHDKTNKMVCAPRSDYVVL